MYPKDWSPKLLRDVGIVLMCRRVFQEQTSPNGQIPFFKIGSFGGTADAYISKELFDRYKSLYPYPKKGDILLSAAGTIGKTVVFDGKDAYFQDSNIVWLDIDESQVDRNYLHWFYRSYPWKALEGTTINRLYNSIILDTEIHLPSLREQHAISEKLSTFDKHIKKLSALIEKKRNIRDGALEDLITNTLRLKGFSTDWVKVSFDQVIKPKARIGWQGLKKDEYLEQGYSYLIGGSDFSSGHINLETLAFVTKKRYDMDRNIQVSNGDVLVTKDGTVGKVAIVQKLNKPATLNSGVFVFKTTNGLESRYLYRVLQSSIFRDFIINLSAGSTIKHLYQKDLKRFVFYMPQSIDEQLAIANILTEMDEEIENLKTERTKMVQIRDGAMDDLLNGRVRLLVEKVDHV